MTVKLSTIIPVYKNQALFLRYLRQNLKYLNDVEIIVVNDDPSTQIETEIKALNQSIIVINNPQNYGFGKSIMIGVKRAKGNYLLLLNSDVLLFNDQYKSALSKFEVEKSLFAVSFAQKEKDKRLVGRNTGGFTNGILIHSAAQSTQSGLNFWAEGGAMLCQKDIFLKLGGFSSLYSPFYWEDIDLGYHAWKKGYQIFFAAEIQVEHIHETTIAKYHSAAHIKVTDWKHRFIFHWLNLTETKLLLTHFFLGLPLLCLRAIKNGDLSFWQGLLSAIKEIGSIQRERRTRWQKPFLSDNEVIRLLHA